MTEEKTMERQGKGRRGEGTGRKEGRRMEYE